MTYEEIMKECNKKYLKLRSMTDCYAYGLRPKWILSKKVVTVIYLELDQLGLTNNHITNKLIGLPFEVIDDERYIMKLVLEVS